jgi:hypothetical protein
VEYKTRSIPYEEDSSTRVRTYEEKYELLTHFTQTVEIDYGIDVRLLNNLAEMITDLGTAIQIAIDEANAKGHKPDKVLEKVIDDIRMVFAQTIQLAAQPGDDTLNNR